MRCANCGISCLRRRRAKSGHGRGPGLLAPTCLPGSPFPGPGGGDMPGRVVLSPDTRRAFVIDALTPHLQGAQLRGLLRREPDAVRASHRRLRRGVLRLPVQRDHTEPGTGRSAPRRRRAGPDVPLSAHSSSDSDGTFACHTWDFGDGESATTTTPEFTHTYRDSRTQTATVAVTDDEDCSTRLIYTGQTVRCSDGSFARASIEVSGQSSVLPRRHQPWLDACVCLQLPSSSRVASG
ncbi:PKD domain-containing protein [Streptomyces sp. NPDC059904]|uniref:PKD domain-containing protein n=1 Tax=Streptomyces sp. NPDC059904 TaxID=3346996 RepID=UPI00364C5328